tara:strand:+ start:1138 stop:1431 length:294 start_codon:yes stop_codon:yes gene_type:complete
MATYYFKVGTGEPFTDKTDAGDDAVAKGHAVKADNAPDNTEAWRMTYNFSTNSVDVYESSMNNEDAQVARKTALDKKDSDESKASKDAQVALDAADA